MDTKILKVGDIKIGIASEDRKIMLILNEQYKAFLIGKQKFHFLVNILIKKVDDEKIKNIREEVLITPNGFKIFSIFFSGEISLKEKKGNFYIYKGSMWTMKIAIENLLRTVTSFLLGENNGLLLHASSVYTERGGVIFCGLSGVGKSTVAKLSQECNDLENLTVLTDDQTIIQLINNEFVTFASPFWGVFNGGSRDGLVRKDKYICGKVNKLFFLKKDTNLFIKSLSRREILERLFPNIILFVPYEKVEREIFDLSIRLIEEIPCYELHFLPNNSFWGEINRLR